MFHLFHHSFQSEVFCSEDEIFSELEACFWSCIPAKSAFSVKVQLQMFEFDLT